MTQLLYKGFYFSGRCRYHQFCKGTLVTNNWVFFYPSLIFGWQSRHMMSAQVKMDNMVPQIHCITKVFHFLWGRFVGFVQQMQNVPSFQKSLIISTPSKVLFA